MKPRIFVSSTFYDLKYIREDLSNFIKAHDFEPILFEDGDIGYTPGMLLDDSCYKTMHSTDMVLLIIGGSYGSPATGEVKDDFDEYMSITRKEFRTALGEGVPVYVFIDDKVYVEYGVYEENCEKIESGEMTINFKNVKNINVFRFINEIKNIGNLSITEFNKIAQIKDFLSKQWSDMFKNYLDILRDQKADKKLENAVDEMKALINRMNMMVDSIGKKVLDNGETVSYKEVIGEIEIRKICDILSAKLSVYDLKSTEKEKNIEVFLEAVIQMIHEHENGETVEETHSTFAKIMLKDIAEGCMTDNSIIDDIHEIKSVELPQVKEKVKEKLLEDKYYKKIFES